MYEAIVRTEDLKSENIKDVFVETKNDKELLEALVGKQPVLLVGSRGTGKTMLLRMAEQKLFNNTSTTKIIPVFVNLASCGMHDNANVLSTIIVRTLISLRKALRRQGILIKGEIFKPVTDVQDNPMAKKLETYISSDNQEYETDIEINDLAIQKDVAHLVDFLEELCDEFEIEKLVFLFDEACQVFNPVQQRIFFDFFRALRSYNIVCKAAVYPGIESYGTFQKMHDATIKKIERTVKSEDYLDKMMEIVKNHFPDNFDIMKRQQGMLDTLIYLSSGNPRFLLKSINEIFVDNGKFQLAKINSVIKEFYGSQIWAEHIKLGEIYTGHTYMLNWVRNFIEDKVLQDIKRLNQSEDKTSIYFAISRNVSEVIKRSIKTLEYSGIIALHTEGTKFRNEMYDRYELNLGIVVLSEEQVNISKRTKEIVSNLSLKVFKDYGASSHAYENIDELLNKTQEQLDVMQVIANIKERNIDELEISSFLKAKLREGGYSKIDDVLSANENKLQSIKYIGPVRSRKISNIVYNAVLEYISG